MTGMELSERYYKVYGTVMIRRGFVQYEPRIAAGLVGDGSDCYGFDDEVSRDHDWGPGFCLWLCRRDYQTAGDALRVEYGKLPGELDGFTRSPSPWGSDRVGVFEIREFYRKFIGLPHAPETLDQWLYLPEESLCACTNGTVFSDALGEFSAVRERLLRFYPEDVRLAKMAAKCISAGQSGQYNYARCVRHGEHYAAQYAETKFCADVMSLVFLLNKRYAPYFKWRHRAVQDLRVLGTFLHEKIGELVGVYDWRKKSNIIECISSEVIKRLQKEGLSRVTSDFLLDHAKSVSERIEDESLRRRSLAQA